jgi:hypothetical protein
MEVEEAIGQLGLGPLNLCFLASSGPRTTSQQLAHPVVRPHISQASQTRIRTARAHGHDVAQP